MHARAANGNVTLIAEIDLQQAEGEFVLALGFGRTAVHFASIRAKIYMKEFNCSDSGHNNACACLY